MNIVIYIRHTEGRPGPSIEEQRNACRKYAAEHSYTITKEYIDSSSNGIDNNRTAFAKMMRDSQKKRFRGVLVYSADRFSRDIHALVVCKVRLERNGVDLIPVTESFRVDPSAVLIESIFQSFAEYMHEEHSEKVKRGIRLAKERKAALAAAESQPNS